MFTIYGCYIQFQFTLITAMYYFHENDPPCKYDPPKPIKMLKMTPSKMAGAPSQVINCQPLWEVFFFFNKRSDAILHMN